MRLFAGVAMIAFGILVVVAVSVYFGFRLYYGDEDNLQSLNVSIQEPPSLPAPVSAPSEPAQTEIRGALTTDGRFVPMTAPEKAESFVSRQELPQRESAPSEPLASAAPPVVVEESVAVEVEAVGSPALEAGSGDSPPRPQAQAQVSAGSGDTETVTEDAYAIGVENAVDAAALVASYNAIYPGHATHPKYWDNPLAAGADEYAYGVALRNDGFLSVSSWDGLPRGALPDATRILIPSIDVDSAIEPLAIVDLGDSRQYETPKHVVGRIPGTATPGEIGNAWLFGHLESPIMGEGNVFQRLPDIPRILKDGDPVYVSLLNDEGDEFLYQVTETEVVYKDDLELYQTEDSTVTLVACVPRLIYDHRILVTGKLVGIRREGV